MLLCPKPVCDEVVPSCTMKFQMSKKARSEHHGVSSLFDRDICCAPPEHCAKIVGGVRNGLRCGTYPVYMSHTQGKTASKVSTQLPLDPFLSQKL